LLHVDAKHHNLYKEKDMTKRWLAATAAAVGMCVTGGALAQMQSDERSFYLGGALGANDDSESAWRLLGGYRAHRNLALELGYADLGDMTIGGNTVNSEAWEVSGLGILPLSEAFSAYGRLGFYRGEARGGGITENNTDLTFGVGAQYDVNRNIGVRLEWQRYTDFGGGALGRVSDQDVVWLNAVYRFR
jgi:OmpA-OmpF porin, OOP family